MQLLRGARVRSGDFPILAVAGKVLLKQMDVVTIEAHQLECRMPADRQGRLSR